MTDAGPAALEIRPALPSDAEGIARAFCESAEHHAQLDPERYLMPPFETILARYREGSQHPPHVGADSITLVAVLRGEAVGFVDARLDRSPDVMHRDMPYCFIAEIAVRSAHRSQGVGARLLRAAEDWGRGRGAAFAILEYNAANKRAGLFYQERMGYRVASLTAIKWL